MFAAEAAQIPTEAPKEDVVASEQPEVFKRDEKADDKQPVENDLKKLNIEEAAQEANAEKPKGQEEGFVPMFFRQCFLHLLQSLFIKLSISKLHIYNPGASFKTILNTKCSTFNIKRFFLYFLFLYFSKGEEKSTTEAKTEEGEKPQKEDTKEETEEKAEQEESPKAE